jgi:hypothetical protein
MKLRKKEKMAGRVPMRKQFQKVSRIVLMMTKVVIQ